MKVTLLAQTEVNYHEIDSLVGSRDFGQRVSGMDGGTDFEYDAEILTEFAGRACYQSWDMPNPDTATPQGYLANIIKQQHFSVMEHASFTLYVEDVSRALLAELTRHRHLSFSVLSQRFVDSTKAGYVVPPALEDIADATLDQAFLSAVATYDSIVKMLESKGLGRKQAREAARAVMPNMTETKIVVTGNHRAWREVISKRWNPHADAEIQRFAEHVLTIAREIAPNLYQDFEG